MIRTEGITNVPEWARNFRIDYNPEYHGYSIAYDNQCCEFEQVKNLLECNSMHCNIPSCVIAMAEVVKSANECVDERVRLFEDDLAKHNKEYNELIKNPRVREPGTYEYRKEYDMRQSKEGKEFLLSKCKEMRMVIRALNDDIAMMKRDFGVS